MPSKRVRISPLSVGHGNDEDDIPRNARTGRPVRKTQGPKVSPGFVDSGQAISDSDGSDDVEDDDEGEQVSSPASRKRQRQRPWPKLPSIKNVALAKKAVDNSNEVTTDSATSPSTPSHYQIIIKEMAINVPPNHQGPITIQLSLPPNIESAGLRHECILMKDIDISSSGSSFAPTKLLTPAQLASHSWSKNPHRKGFLDLPRELRDDIYERVFVIKRGFRFHRPIGFSRSAAFLRTCKQIHEEGTTILYSENHFYFARRTDRSGSFWKADWPEVGWRPALAFVRAIGPKNIALLRRVTFCFSDATPSSNPNKKTPDDRRFVNDDILMDVLDEISLHGRLHRLGLYFYGRRRLGRKDFNFLEHLQGLRADEVAFLGGYYATESKHSLEVERTCRRLMTRKPKMYEHDRLYKGGRDKAPIYGNIEVESVIVDFRQVHRHYPYSDR